MPSTATITSFYTFAVKTKARSSEVNTNFGVFRGHIIPVNTDTASASDLTHDLGSETHRWNKVFVGTINLESSTNTASLEIKGQTTNTLGSFDVLIGGSTIGTFDSNGFAGPYSPGSINTTTSFGTGVLPEFISQTFTSNASFTIPSGVDVIIIKGIGAGGGGGAGSGNNLGGGGAGGEGSESKTFTVPVTPGNVLSITVGTGGTGGLGSSTAIGASGSDGSVTIVANTGYGTITFGSGRGGAGGQAASGGASSSNQLGNRSHVITGSGAGCDPGTTNGTSGGNNTHFDGGSIGAGGGGGNGGPGGGGGAGLSDGGQGGSGGAGGGGNAISGSYGAGGGGGGGAGSSGQGGNGGDGGDGYVEITYIN